MPSRQAASLTLGSRQAASLTLGSRQAASLTLGSRQAPARRGSIAELGGDMVGGSFSRWRHAAAGTSALRRCLIAVAGLTCAATAACTTARPADSRLPGPVSATESSAPSSSAPGSAGSATPVVPTVTVSPSASAQALITAKPSPKAQPKPVPPAPPPLLVQQLASVGNAKQVVTVTSSSWSSSTATVQTFERTDAGWRAVFPAMPAYIGLRGFSANRTEGDATTPTGMYGFGTMFGQQPNPGVKFPYRRPDAQSVWVSDSASPYYNTWQQDASLVGEHLASATYAVQYAYAIAINFNTAPVVPHKGSAIFFHVSTGHGTAGCVSVSQSDVLRVLRWLDPAAAPVIVMGPTSVIRQY